ncbi:MAG: hypothetical protein IIB44_10195 [Candidatus Marinimicrobia bacterium]|nr:hypothetical protein [Candidatus Neomarinimicrobiota bacterium]MCH8069145.1 hypothetical protein [Candidatus Neomarinimicrobiota bacterium]
MWRDSIVEEVRRVREEHAAKFNYDLDAIYRDLKNQEKKSKRKIVSLSPRILKKANKEEVSILPTHV